MLDATKSQALPHNTTPLTNESTPTSDSETDAGELEQLRSRVGELERDGAALALRERQLHTIVSHLDEGLFLMDAHGVILFANPQSERLLQTPASHLIGHTTHGPGWNLMRPDGTPMPATSHPADLVIASREPHHGVIAGLQLPSGDMRWLRCSGSPIFSDEGETLEAILCTFSDFTEYVLAEHRLADINSSLRASEARLSEAQRLGKFGTWEWDVAREITSWSIGLYELLERDPTLGPADIEEIIPRIHHEDRVAFAAAIRAAAEQGKDFDLEFRYSRSLAENLVLHASAQVFCRDGKPIRVLGNVQDVTERRAAQSQIEWQMRTISSYAAELEVGKRQLEQANAQLEALATTDGLTGLMNHRAFQEKAEQEFKRARRYDTALSMLLIDVDKFKSYNDSFGHQAGDAVLRAVANTLHSAGRETDWLARYGGEEFVAILPETSLSSALDAAERFRIAINNRALGSRELSISVGVASLGEAHMKPADLLADADRALYFAKESGRNRVAWVDPATGTPSVGA